jgi:hypothetical protein
MIKLRALRITPAASTASALSHAYKPAISQQRDAHIPRFWHVSLRFGDCTRREIFWKDSSGRPAAFQIECGGTDSSQGECCLSTQPIDGEGGFV